MAGDGLSADARHILERRRLRRRLGFWRLAAILALVAAVAAAGWRAIPAGEHIARFAVLGTIVDDPDRDATLRAIARDDAVRALVLRIDSPGGSVAGSEALYAALRAVAAEKPVVAVMGELAASGGYVAALAADHIIARGATLTGSIGVIAEFPNVEKLLDTVGVGVSRVASAPLKAEPSLFRAPDAAVLAAQQELIVDAYDWFVGLVAERRRLTPETARAVGDGRVYSGRSALARGLVDAIGGETEARAWLEAEHGLPATMPARDIDVDRDDGVLADLLGAAAARLGLPGPGGGPRLMAMMR